MYQTEVKRDSGISEVGIEKDRGVHTIVTITGKHSDRLPGKIVY